MRLPREITAEEENFRLEPAPAAPHIAFIRRDPVQPEPIGTILLVPVRIIGYDSDCDGSLMARLYHMDLDEIREPYDEYLTMQPEEVSRYSGFSTNHGIYPSTGFVVTEDELEEMKRRAQPAEAGEEA